MHGFGRRTILVALSLILGLLALPLSAESTQGKTVVKIGALLDQQQGTLSTSPLFTMAVELAVLQMNEALEHRGARVEFEVVFGNAKSSAAVARPLALDLINKDGVVGLLTMTSGETQGVNRYNYQDAALVVNPVPITCFQCSSGSINDTANADPSFADPDKWLFRVFYNANYEAAVLSQVIANSATDTNGDGTLKVGILHDPGHASVANAITTELLSHFHSGAVSVERTSLAAFTVAPAPPDFVAAWAAVMAGNPDVVVMAMLPGVAGDGIKAYRAGGYTLPISSNNAFRRDFLLANSTVAAAAEGLEGSSVTLVDNSASGQDFLEAFEAYSGQKPELTSSGAYDGVMTLMLAALAAAGDSHRPDELTPAAVRDALARINDPAAPKIRPTVEDLSFAARLLWAGKTINYEGAYNSDDWNAVGDIFPPLVHWKVENGRFVEKELYNCDPAHPLCPVAQ
jgi:ABC-type branched-subunit amino acid transport system substrate-binding protein